MSESGLRRDAQVEKEAIDTPRADIGRMKCSSRIE